MQGSPPGRRPDDEEKKERDLRPLLAGIVAVVVIAALASILIQRGSDDDEPEAAAAAGASPPVAKALGALTPEQKVDAVLVTGFDDPAAAEAQLGKTQLGGVLVGPEDWQSGGPALTKALRAAGSGKGRIGPLIVGTQEGGVYRDYPDLPPEQLEIEIGESADPALAESSARETAAALKQAGFDLNLAPVADVATIDSPIADRAYSDDAALVSTLTAAAVTGCKAGGIACAVSHFPGLGGANSDPDAGPATVSLDAASLQVRDLAPFRAAFEAGVPATELSLAFYAAYDPVTPAALAPSVATDLLRGEMGFTGVAVTGDLTSGAITAGIGAPEAAVQALAAGSDLIVVGDPAQAEQARAALVEAVNSEGIPPERLDEAVTRVLEMKRTLGLL
jgi:beta-N-acetylhexosaminidase